jgi:hypothetical protein
MRTNDRLHTMSQMGGGAKRKPQQEDQGSGKDSVIVFFGSVRALSENFFE